MLLQTRIWNEINAIPLPIRSTKALWWVSDFIWFVYTGPRRDWHLNDVEYLARMDGKRHSL